MNFIELKLSKYIKKIFFKTQSWKIYFKYFETRNVKYADEILPLRFDIECFIDSFHEPVEAAAVNGLAQGANRIYNLIPILAFVDVLIANLFVKISYI